MPDPEPGPPLQLPPGAREVRLRGERLEARGEPDEAWSDIGPVGFPRNRPPVGTLLRHPAAALRRLLAVDWHAGLFWLALALYLAVRLIALADYPIFFFSDEAIQTVLASDLARDGMRGYSGELFPAYFPNAGQYNLSLSVYVQLAPYLLFGKTVWATRGTAALLSILAALGCGLLLREGLGMKRAWLGILLLSAAPAWFLHSRTAFETALAVDFYAVFLCAYILYRKGRTRWIIAAAGAAALCFYAYAPAQIVIAATALLLFFSDLGYHWRQRRALLPALGLGLLFLAPYIRHQALHPGSVLRHLAILESYWTAQIPVGEKLAKAAGIYLHGLDPLYWFLPNDRDLARHTMGSWGHLLHWTLPFYLLGLGAALRHIRRSEYRALLLALLACPLGAVPVELGITRVLCLVVPGALLSAIGFNTLIDLLGGRRKAAWLGPLAAGASAVVLAASSPLLLVSALRDGPLWSEHYGLGGMQYGAVQVFSAIREVQRSQPGRPVVLSPTWANATDVLARFFLPDPLPAGFRVDGIRSYSEVYNPFPPETLFVLPGYEFDELPRDMFGAIEVERILPYPNGQPGFYFTRLGYAADAEQILLRRKEERSRPVTETVQVLGMPVEVTHARLDIGAAKHIFDGDAETLVRSEIANPLVIELAFPQPVDMEGLALRVGGVPTQVRVQAATAQGEARTWELSLPEDPFPRTGQIDFGSRLAVQSLRVEVRNSADPPEAHVHLWEIWFR